jgi:hypothetical protein
MNVPSAMLPLPSFKGMFSQETIEKSAPAVRRILEALLAPGLKPGLPKPVNASMEIKALASSLGGIRGSALGPARIVPAVLTGKSALSKSAVKKLEIVCARENKWKSDLKECNLDFTLLQLTSVARTITTEARLSSQKRKLEESLEREKSLQSRYGVYKAELPSLHESFNRKQK